MQSSADFGVEVCGPGDSCGLGCVLFGREK